VLTGYTLLSRSNRHFSFLTFRNFRRKGTSPTNHCWCRRIALTCGIKISAVHCTMWSLTNLTDGPARRFHGVGHFEGKFFYWTVVICADTYGPLWKWLHHNLLLEVFTQETF